MVNKEMRTPAVVLGLSPTGLAVVRALGRQGVPVWGTESTQWAVGYFSKYCRRLPAFEPQEEGEKLTECLLDFAKKYSFKKPVLIPTGDEHLAYLAQHWQKLEDKYSFYRMDEETLELFLNKEKFYRKCMELEVPAPQTFFLSDNDIGDIAERVNYPCILKPIYTHVWAKEFGLRKVFECANKDELLKAYSALPDNMKGNVLVQEVVPGGDEKIYVFAAYFDRQSQPHCSFVGRKLRQYPPGYGTTTMAEPVLNERVAHLSIKFLQGVGFWGMCDAEFKYDERDGEYKMMEINPRPGRWYSMVERAGAGVVYACYLDLAGEGIPEELEEGARDMNFRWIIMSRELPAALFYMKRGELSLNEWMRQIFEKPREWGGFTPDDPLPFVGYFFEMAAKVGKIFRTYAHGR